MQPTSEQSHENHTIPDMLLWRGRARYRPHFTDMQEPSGIERRDMAITNNTPGEALWTRGCPTEHHQIRSGNWTPIVKANEKKKMPGPLKILTVVQMDTDVLIISCAKSIAGPKEFLLGYWN